MAQKYCKINGAAVNYSDADPVNIQRSTTAPDQCEFVLRVPYTTTLPVVGQHLEWFRADGTRVFNGIISEIDWNGLNEGGAWLSVPIKGVGFNDRLYHRTTFNRLTSVCAQYRSFTATVDASNVSGVGHIYWKSGDHFAQVIVGKTVQVNGSPYTVATAVSPTELTISGAFGGPLSSVTFTYLVYWGDVVKDLLDNYASFEGFTYDSVSIQQGGALDSKGVLFDPPVFVQDAINTALQANPDFYFAVDVNQKCWFATRTLVTAPADFTTTSGKQKRGVQMKVTAADVRNVEISTVDWTNVDDSTATITGDGASRSWFLPKPIASVVSALLNGVPVDLVDGTNSGSTGAFYFFPNDNIVWQAATDPTLSSADSLVVTFKATAENLIEYSDDVARAARQAIEGSGFGRYEQAIDRTAYGRVSALAASTASVNRLKDNYQELNLNTFELGYDIGQVVTLDIPKLQISGITYFIDQVTMDDSNCKGSYDFEYTLRLVSVTRRLTDDDVLRSLFGNSAPSVGVSSATGAGSSGSTPAIVQDVVSVSGLDVNTHTQDASQLTYTDIKVTGTVNVDAGTQPVTLYLSKDGGANYMWLGQYQHSGTTFTVDFISGYAALVPATNQTWTLAAKAGAIPGVGGLLIPASALPVGAVISTGFTVHGLPAPTSSGLGTGFTATGPTYAGINGIGNPFWTMTINGTIPASVGAGFDPNIWTFEVTVQGVNASGVADPGPSPNAGETEWFEFVNGIGAVIHSPVLEGNYNAPGSAYTYLRIKIYAVNRNNTTVPGWRDPSAVLVGCWSGGATNLIVSFGPNPGNTLQLNQADPNTYNNNYVGIGPDSKITTLVAYGDNMLANAGFEQGLVGWTAFYTGPTNWTVGTHSHTIIGTYSLQAAFTAGSTDEVRIRQYVAVKPGDLMAVTAYLDRSSGTATKLFTCRVVFYDVSGTQLRADALWSVPSSVGWTKWTASSLPAPANAAYVLVQFGVEAGSAGDPAMTFFLDDVSAIRLSSGQVGTQPTSDGGYQVSSGNIGHSMMWDWDFELSPLGQIAYGNQWVWTGSAVVTGGGGYIGSKFCRLTNANAAVAQNFSVIPGQAIYMEAYVRSSNTAGTHSVSLMAVFLDNTGAILSTVPLTASGYIASWTKLSGVAQAPANAASMQITLVVAAAETAGGYWDADSVMVQPVVNRTASGQVTTMVPSALGGSGYSALMNTSGTYTSEYGLSRVYLNDSGSGGSSMIIDNGGGGTTITMTAGAHQLVILVSSAGIQVTIDGSVGFTGAVTGRNAKNGFVI